jgi:L-lactate dehydrogenase complex protein LldE
MMRAKRDKISRMDTGAEYIVGTDGSCLMHQNGIIAREKLPIKTIHIVEVLAAGL